LFFQVFSFYWRRWYGKFAAGSGTLTAWASTFDAKLAPKKMSSVTRAVNSYLKFCISSQNKSQPSRDTKPSLPIVLSVKPVFSPKGHLPVLTGNRSKRTLIPARPCTSKLVPKTEPIELIESQVSTGSGFFPPDQTCHRLPFSSSVLRIPYLVFDRVVDHSTKIKVDKKLKSGRPLKFSSSVKKNKISAKKPTKRSLYTPDVPTAPFLKHIKLEDPEVFVASDHGYQYVSRPEFSDDDSSLVITISSDSG
jgi:hypothetical protein